MSFQIKQFLRSRVSLPEKLLAATLVVVGMMGTLPFCRDNLDYRQYAASQILKEMAAQSEKTPDTETGILETLPSAPPPSTVTEPVASVPQTTPPQTTVALFTSTWQPIPNQSPYSAAPVPASTPTPTPTPTPSPAPTPTPTPVPTQGALNPLPTPTPIPTPTPGTNGKSENVGRGYPREEMRRILEVETGKIQQAIEDGRRYGHEKGLLIEAHFALGTNQWSVRSADAVEGTGARTASYQVQSPRSSSRSQAEVTWQFLSFRGPGNSAADPVFVFFPDGDVQGGAVRLGWEGFTRVLELDNSGRIQCRFEGNL
ncbi:MAG TPA: hypothetical protein PLA90_05525 [Candidatus Sumerlaeota bacterium]|nr:hypothetical protein [Candidatus Sumerlaeota bacterium]HPS00984.1 hypothetical protein [Candidatus Sumerlaeota bacterium]